MGSQRRPQYARAMYAYTLLPRHGQSNISGSPKINLSEKRGRNPFVALITYSPKRWRSNWLPATRHPTPENKGVSTFTEVFEGRFAGVGCRREAM